MNLVTKKRNPLLWYPRLLGAQQIQLSSLVALMSCQCGGPVLTGDEQLWPLVFG